MRDCHKNEGTRPMTYPTLKIDEEYVRQLLDARGVKNTDDPIFVTFVTEAWIKHIEHEEDNYFLDVVEAACDSTGGFEIEYEHE